MKVLRREASQYTKEETDSMQIIFYVNVFILSFPVFAAIYSKMIYNVKWMSKDIPNPDDEDYDDQDY